MTDPLFRGGSPAGTSFYSLLASELWSSSGHGHVASIARGVSRWPHWLRWSLGLGYPGYMAGGCLRR